MLREKIEKSLVTLLGHVSSFIQPAALLNPNLACVRSRPHPACLVCFLQNQHCLIPFALPVLAMLAHCSVEKVDFDLEGVRVYLRYAAKVLF